MINKFETNKFVLTRRGSNMVEIRIINMGSGIVTSIRDIDLLIEALNKAKEEFK